jgi:hypothetical protein
LRVGHDEEQTMWKAAVFLGVLAVAATAPVSDASACGFVEYRSVHPVRRAPPKPEAIAVAPPMPAVDRISLAEQRLEDEQPAAAGTEVVGAFPGIRGTMVGTSPLETRALRIAALSLVRGGGVLAGVRGFASTVDRDANLEWAVSTLRTINAVRTNDPVAMADLAEALSTRTKYEAESLQILQDLTGRDLVGSAHAYAVLARLHAGKGDEGATRADLDRCRIMTKQPAAVCKAPDGRVASRD